MVDLHGNNGFFLVIYLKMLLRDQSASERINTLKHLSKTLNEQRNSYEHMINLRT